MLTALLGYLVSALIFAGIWRLFLGPEKRERAREDERPVITFNITADYETLRRFGAELRERDEVERLERAWRR